MLPLRDIQHRIDQALGAILLNKLHNRMSLSEHQELQRQVEHLISKGYLCRSSSDYAILALLILKKYGSWHICVDSHVINKIIVRYQFLILCLEDLFDQSSGITIFMKLALKSVYH